MKIKRFLLIFIALITCIVLTGCTVLDTTTKKENTTTISTIEPSPTTTTSTSELVPTTTTATKESSDKAKSSLKKEIHNQLSSSTDSALSLGMVYTMDVVLNEDSYSYIDGVKGNESTYDGKIIIKLQISVNVEIDTITECAYISFSLKPISLSSTINFEETDKAGLTENFNDVYASISSYVNTIFDSDPEKEGFEESVSLSLYFNGKNMIYIHGSKIFGAMALLFNTKDAEGDSLEPTLENLKMALSKATDINYSINLDTVFAPEEIDKDSNEYQQQSTIYANAQKLLIYGKIKSFLINFKGKTIGDGYNYLITAGIIEQDGTFKFDYALSIISGLIFDDDDDIISGIKEANEGSTGTTTTTTTTSPITDPEGDDKTSFISVVKLVCSFIESKLVYSESVSGTNGTVFGIVFPEFDLINDKFYEDYTLVEFLQIDEEMPISSLKVSLSLKVTFEDHKFVGVSLDALLQGEITAKTDLDKIDDSTITTDGSIKNSDTTTTTTTTIPTTDETEPTNYINTNLSINLSIKLDLTLSYKVAYVFDSKTEYQDISSSVVSFIDYELYTEFNNIQKQK